jgi:polyisoprenoid-binding protein YceI
MRMTLLASTALLLTAAGPSHRYAIDPAGSDVSAKVAFFGLASKTAHFPKLSGGITLDPARPESATLDVELDARALTAPDNVTLGRLKSEKFFWVDRYPMVRFVGHGLRVSGDRSGTVQGEITARGVTRPASVAVTFAQSIAHPPAGPIDLTGRTTIDRRAFGMTAYSLIVGRKVAITIKVRMVPA